MQADKMQPLSIMDTLSNMDIEEEMVTFLCSVIAFLILIAFRNQKSRAKKSGKLFNQVEYSTNDGGGSELRDDKYYVKMDKAFRNAFEKEDYWQVLKCWWQLKHFNQSSIHLPMIIRAMRFCNKGAFFIATEIKNFFKAHPQECSITVMNDLLEPLSRRSDDAQLVDLLVKMMPSINLSKDSRTYEIVLTMLAANGNLTKTQEVMSEMKTQDIEFTPRATVAAMTLGLRTGNADVVLKAFAKLKPFWNERDTWAVSMFALERHKVNVLTQVVTLASWALETCELSKALENMALPEEVLDILRTKFTALSDAELASGIEALEEAGVDLDTDLVYSTMMTCKNKRASIKPCPPWKLKKSNRTELSSPAPWKVKKAQVVDSDASTSEGSRSESEEETSFAPCIRPPPGLALPVC